MSGDTGANIVTRRNLALNYNAGNPQLPPPLCWGTPLRNRPPAQVRVYGGGAPGLNLGAPKNMMDPSDPSTWQRAYWFDAMPVVADPQRKQYARARRYRYGSR